MTRWSKRRRHTVVAGIIGGLTVTAAVAVFIVLQTRTESDTGASQGPPALAATDAGVLERKLASHDRAEVASVLAAALAPSFQETPDSSLLPEGTTLHIDLSGFTRTGPDTAEVPVTLTGPRPGTCSLLLIFENDHWAIYSTTEVH